MCLREDNTTENMLFHYPIYIKNSFRVSNDVNIRFMCCVIWSHGAFQNLLQLIDPQSEHQVLMKELGGTSAKASLAMLKISI